MYCLRTTLTEPTETEPWRIYSMLTNPEAVFRSPKTDLGLRPIHHRIEPRVEAQLLLSVLAYYFVDTLRLQLKAQGIDESWQRYANRSRAKCASPPPRNAAMVAPCMSEKPAGPNEHNRKSTPH